MSGRGRPKSSSALTNAERQRRYKERHLSIVQSSELSLLTQNNDDVLAIEAKKIVDDLYPDFANQSKEYQSYILSLWFVATFGKNVLFAQAALHSAGIRFGCELPLVTENKAVRYEY
jgi:hypothetical protein